LFIFGPPEILDFFLKTIYECFIAREQYFFNFSHRMPVVIVMTIVVAKNAPVIKATNAWIYIGKTIFHNLAPTYQTSSLSTAPRLLPVKYDVLSTLFSTFLDFPTLFLAPFRATGSRLYN
jgi:hypothetical protein